MTGVDPPAPARSDEPPRPVAPVPGPIDATVRVPGSKSITNRALLVAALADGPSELSGVLEADDTAAMIGCLRSLHIDVDHDAAAEVAVVHGRGGVLPTGEVRLDARQSGTTARFLPAVLATGPGRYRLDGDGQLRARPFGPLFAALRSLGAVVEATGDDVLPATISGAADLDGAARAADHAGAAATAGEVAISGDVSSQFISGLMVAAPQRAGGLRIGLTTPLVSRPYVTMTAQVMATFGIDAEVGETVVRVPGGRYRARSQRIEADASAASYFFGAAAICGGRVRVQGLGAVTSQGDAAFADLLGRMGCTVRRGADWTEVAGPPDGVLHGIEADLGDLSDTAPTLAAVAPFAAGPVRMTGIGFIRRKESDRIGAVVAELRRLGADAVEEPDGMVVRPSTAPLHGATVQTYDDHRLAMAFSLVGLRVPGVVIAGPGCVAKTFPTYWSVFEQLRGAPG